jgi:hypothetical protein
MLAVCSKNDLKADRQSTRTNSGQETAMPIAVIGATGNTGRAVVKELRALGQNPVCVLFAILTKRAKCWVRMAKPWSRN